MAKIYDQPCPIAKALEFLGERWTLLIVRDIMRGMNKFSELNQSVPGITASVLAARLKILEEQGVVESKLYQDHPPRAAYHLTKKGKELGKIVGALYLWGQKHCEVGSKMTSSDCGHQLELAYFCPTCQSKTSPKLPFK